MQLPLGPLAAALATLAAALVPATSASAATLPTASAPFVFRCGRAEVIALRAVGRFATQLTVPAGCPLAGRALSVELQCTERACLGRVLDGDDEVATIAGTPHAPRVSFAATRWQGLLSLLVVGSVTVGEESVPDDEYFKLPVSVVVQTEHTCFVLPLGNPGDSVEVPSGRSGKLGLELTLASRTQAAFTVWAKTPAGVSQVASGSDARIDCKAARLACEGSIRVQPVSETGRTRSSGSVAALCRSGWDARRPATSCEWDPDRSSGECRR